MSAFQQRFDAQHFSNGYELVNGVAMHAENPENFHILPEVIKRHIRPGQFIELRIDSPRFSVHEDAPEKCTCPSWKGEMTNEMHNTASVFINDDESGLHKDYKEWLEGLAPFDASPQRYAHNRTGEDSADAHMKRQVMGREVVVAIPDGKLSGRGSKSLTVAGPSVCWLR